MFVFKSIVKLFFRLVFLANTSKVLCDSKLNKSTFYFKVNLKKKFYV